MKSRRLIHNLPSLIERRRELRRDSTLAERLLWSSLRARRLDGKKFRRQHSIGPYIADFYCPECRVIVELDCEVHKGEVAAEYDDKRSTYLAQFGIKVIRLENNEVLQNRELALESIRAVLRTRA
jgi:very-short-patch-repair endonuclease